MEDFVTVADALLNGRRRAWHASDGWNAAGISAFATPQRRQAARCWCRTWLAASSSRCLPPRPRERRQFWRMPVGAEGPSRPGPNAFKATTTASVSFAPRAYVRKSGSLPTAAGTWRNARNAAIHVDVPRAFNTQPSPPRPEFLRLLAASPPQLPPHRQGRAPRHTSARPA